MVEKIYDIKNQILQRVDKDIQERGVDRIDVKEVGELVDMVKDLAEAEKSCWEAQYYRSVTEAMSGTSGYSGSGYSVRQGYSQMNQGYSRGSMGHSELVNKLGEEYRKLSPDEQMMMKSNVLKVFGAM